MSRPARLGMIGMMRKFDDTADGEQEEYVAWRQNNPDAFVLNCVGRVFTMHRARCLHLGQFTKFEASLIRRPKICAADRELLQEWAKSEGITTILSCKTCTPYAE